MSIKKFQKSVDVFKTKYQAIYEIQQIENKDYLSLDELKVASEQLADLDTKLNNEDSYRHITIDQDYVNAKSEAIQSINEQKIELEKIEQINKKDESELTAEEIKLKEDWNKKKKEREEFEEFKKKNGIDKEAEKTNQALETAANDLDKLSETLSGHVSIDDISKAASQFDSGYDQTISDLSTVLAGDKSTKYIEAWARTQFGDKIYEAASAIKNGASTAIEGVADYMSLKNTFGGSWRNPMTAAKKIQTGLQTIQSAAGKISKVANNVFSAITGRDSVILGKLDLTQNKEFSKLVTLSGVASVGIGSFYAFKDTKIAGGINGIGDVMNSMGQISEKGLITGQAAPIELNDVNTFLKEDNINPETAESINDINNSFDEDNVIKNEDLQLETDNSAKGGASSDSNTDDFSADMISEINVVLDGSSSSQNSLCTINGNEYRLSSYSLSQELLQPMILSFSIEKEDKTETNSDVIFSDSTNIIGKSLEIHVSTIKTSLSDEDSSSQKAFVFKGMIIDVSASRTTASTQSASVTVATWDALLQNAPHCRSFEDMTLKDIIESVLKPYSDIKSKISPRFKDKIPYIVQYNQSDYAFISMLAVRFGEWMYNTGETFIFGEIEDSGSSANLEYPGGSLMSYNLHQSMTSFSFNHLLPDYYQYGKEKAILKESAQGVADGAVNNWTDKAFNASMQRFKNEQIATLNAGGFDSGKEDEGSDSILDYSLKIEAQGKKTGIMTVQGFSKLAMLKIGQTFLIRDNVQNKSGESKDVEQKALKIIGINHSFDYRQEYSNSFTAIPVACNYPSYSDADVFPSAPQQRAKVVENKDEQKLGRIRVQFPWQEIQSKEMKTPWLRIAVPYAGASKGHQFVPEIGEEVMVGFEMDNAEKPYIIGALYNGGNGKPDENWAVSKEEDGTTNNIKAIRTRNGHTIEIHDKGDDGYIRIYDNKKENYILTFSTDEKLIKLESTGNIELYAKNDIIMHAGHDINVKAGNDRNTYIGRNDSLTVDSNQFIRVNANKDERVNNKLQVTAESIRIEAEKKLLEYSETHQQKASGSMKINAADLIEIKASIIKNN